MGSCKPSVIPSQYQIGLKIAFLLFNRATRLRYRRQEQEVIQLQRNNRILTRHNNQEQQTRQVAQVNPYLSQPTART